MKSLKYTTTKVFFMVTVWLIGGLLSRNHPTKLKDRCQKQIDVQSMIAPSQRDSSTIWACREVEPVAYL